MSNDVKNYVLSCKNCNLSKLTRKNQLPINKIPYPEGRFNSINIDIVGPLNLTSNGNKYIITIIDRFTKYLLAIPIKSADSATIIKIITDRYISLFGIPTTITTDNGSCFTSELFNQFTTALNIKTIKTTPYNPKANGLLERRHRTIKNSIRSLNNLDTEWDMLIPIIQLGWNNSSMNNQFTPSQIVFGQSMRLPGDFFSNTTTATNINKQQVQQFINHMNQLKPAAINHNSNKSNTIFRFKKLEDCKNVLILDQNKSSKLDNNYRGPFKVIKRHDSYYEIMKDNGKILRVHLKDIKPAYEIIESDENTIPVVIEQEKGKLQLDKEFRERKELLEEQQQSKLQHSLHQFKPYKLINHSNLNELLEQLDSKPNTRLKSKLMQQLQYKRN